MLSGDELMAHLEAHRKQVAAQLAAVDRLITLLGRHLNGLEPRLRSAEAPQLMTITRAAKYLGMSRNGLYKLIDIGQLPVVELSDGSTRVGILKAELDAYLAARPPRSRPRGAVTGSHG